MCCCCKFSNEIMSVFGNVQRKISCVFEVSVIPNVPSEKRSDQSYKVVATDRLREKASAALNCGPEANSCCRATEKLDGTCVFISEFCGKPWLWARHDRKPNKAADKRFRKFQNEHPQSRLEEKDGVVFQWKVENDFKDVPTEWIPAIGIGTKDGVLLPDANGHIPGWVPVDPKSKQHCWHASAVDLNIGVGLVLQQQSNRLEITLQLLKELSGSTMELIGTNVNGNPYRLGSKSKPVHLLVRHGIIPAENVPPASFAAIKDWFQGPDGGVEGIVWHFDDGEMLKLHRHHMSLNWPVVNPKLLSIPAVVNVPKDDLTTFSSKLLLDMANISGQTFDSLDKINFD